jgi:AcrR family transcriptional regulator
MEMGTTTACDAALGPETLDVRVLEGTVRCLGRWGMAKTTVDDIAREAGCSRASVYRRFPGGKDHLLLAAGQYEEGRLFATIAGHLEAAPSLEELLVVGIHRASCFLAANEALQYLIDHEPESILPYIAFDRVGPLLYRAAVVVAPYLERFVPTDDVAGIAEWAVRLVVSYALYPSEHLDLCDEADVRRLVSTYLMPGLRAIDSKGSTNHVID